MKHRPVLESSGPLVDIIEYDTIRVITTRELGPVRFEVETAWDPAVDESRDGIYLLTRDEAEQIIEGLTQMLDATKGETE